MVSEIAMPEAVYYCFTRTTLFTKLFTCFYDQTYCCVSESLSYCMAWGLFYKNYIVYRYPIPWSLWISVSTQSFVSQLCMVIEIG